MLFWILAVVLLALVLVMLALGVFRQSSAPASAAAAALLIYKDQLAELARERSAGRLQEDTYLAAKLEVERRMLSADTAATTANPPANQAANRAADPAAVTASYRQRLMLIALLTVILLLGAPLSYWQLGRPGQADQPYSGRAAERAQAAEALAQQQQIENMVAGLAARLKAAPDDLQGWLRLARSYMVMERFPAAVKAFQQAARLAPERTDILVAWSEALLATTPLEAGFPAGFADLIGRIEALDADHPRALFFLGEIAARAGRGTAAREYWQRLLAKLPKDSPLGAPLAARIEALANK
ncbi:c-type cytochrome biogenesis protein CcmI [Alphaproteobacteria bacterium]|nr:c-type cytochrome biogenesis protein CcmI [Alphaproteobacteria bacterium]|tara:strand:+ start:526 stop:1425 length:900 start_codon:yes stop_codon:yes gene_type:complete